MADEKLFFIEKDPGPYETLLRNVMRMVPDRDKHDPALQRLLAFRLRIDGEGATREYLMRKIREMIQCSFHGSLYEFLKDDKASQICPPFEGPPLPPTIA
jgi:hypothetical protein